MSSELIAALAVSAGLFAAAVGVRTEFVDPVAEARRSQRMEDDVLASPGPDALQLAAMEHAEGWSDLLWLEIVQELGKPLEGGPASWDRVQRWSYIVVDLDPGYFAVYYASSIHLIVYAHRASVADQLLLKGRKNLPQRWELPFLLGYTAYFIHGDAKKAADWWHLSASLPEAPYFMPSLATRAQAQTGDRKGAIEALEKMLEVLEGPHRIDAEIRLKIFKTEEEVFPVYDEACKKYRAEHNGLTPTAEQLYNEHLVAIPPVDRLDSKLRLDENCLARSEQIPVRDDEAAKENIGSQGKKGPDAPIDLNDPEKDPHGQPNTP